MNNGCLYLPCGVAIVFAAIAGSWSPGFTGPQAAAKIAPKEEANAKLKQLEAIKEYKVLVLETKRLLHVSQEVGKELFILCLHELKSTKALELAGPDKKIKQDLATEGGRCAWLIDQLLDCSLPIIIETPKEKQDVLVREAYNRVIRKLFVPTGHTDVKKASKEEEANGKLIKLEDIKDYQDLLVETKSFPRLTQELRKELIILCLHELKSTEALAIVGPDKTIHQDLATEGGRCAWLIEQMLDCTLPIVNRAAKEKQDALVREAYDLVVTKLYIPTSPIDVKKLSEADKLVFAASGQTHLYVLGLLSEDPHPAVRKAIAANRKTPLSILYELRDNDPDPQIRATAKETLEARYAVPQGGGGKR
jgi:hypothetical protein